MTNFSRHLYDASSNRKKTGRSDASGGFFRTLNAYVVQMSVAASFAAVGFYMFFLAPNYALGLLFWFAGIVFGAHFSDKAYARIRFRSA